MNTQNYDYTPLTAASCGMVVNVLRHWGTGDDDLNLVLFMWCLWLVAVGVGVVVGKLV